MIKLLKLRSKEEKGKGALPSLPNPPPFFPSAQSPSPFDASYAGSRENEVSIYLIFCITSFGDSTRLQHQESTL